MDENIIAAIQELPEQRQLAYVYRRICGWSYTKIATKMNINKGTVGRYIADVRSHLVDFARRNRIEDIGEI